MYLTLVKFGDSDKKYLFSANTQYEVGDKVVCDTCRGEQVGEVVDVSTLQGSEENLKIASHSLLSMLLRTAGATLPLRKIIRKYGVPRIAKITDTRLLERACNDFINQYRPEVPEEYILRCFVEFLGKEVEE